jgi:hypothetical protein
MRKVAFVLGFLWLLEPLGAAGFTGDAEGTRLVNAAIAALGGPEGIEKRRMLSMEQEAVHQLPGSDDKTLKIRNAEWIKGDKVRLEQRIGNAPGSPIVAIYDGKDLFVLENGRRRDPGMIMKKAFEAGKKREDLWADCLRKPLRVASLGAKEIRKKGMNLVEFTHPEGEKTVVGLDPQTNLPIYCTFKGPHPQTGKEVVWAQWQSEFAPVKEAADLLFPKTMELFYDEQKMLTATLIKVTLEKEIPESLFGESRPVD